MSRQRLIVDPTLGDVCQYHFDLNSQRLWAGRNARALERQTDGIADRLIQAYREGRLVSARHEFGALLFEKPGNVPWAHVDTAFLAELKRRYPHKAEEIEALHEQIQVDSIKPTIVVVSGPKESLETQLDHRGRNKAEFVGRLYRFPYL